MTKAANTLYQLSAGRIICLGKFEALHQGHRALIERAAQLGSVAVLQMTGMAEVLGWEARPPLSCPSQRVNLLRQWGEACGQDVQVLELPFATLRNLSPQAFGDYLRDELQVAGIVVGEDFRFGYRRAGATADLVSYGAANELSVQVVAVVSDEDGPISSSRIRHLLASGAVDRAADLLGRPHRCCGSVVRGDGRGRKMGIPTANIGHIHNVIPANGVYVGRAILNSGERHFAAVNIGNLPTISEGRSQSVEAHLLGFKGDIYDQDISIDFLHKLRDEQRFPTLPELMKQIHKDIANVYRFIDQQANDGNKG